MKGVSPDKTEIRKRVAAILSVGKESPLYGSSGMYDKVMLEAIVSAEPEAGHFREILTSVIDARMEVALHDKEYDVVSVLSEFGFYRSLGLRPSKNSFSAFHMGGHYDDLINKIETNIFSNPRCGICIKQKNDAAREFKINYKIGKSSNTWTYRITIDQHKTVKVFHASNFQVPPLLSYLNSLWDTVLRAGTLRRKLEAIAAFEWWFIAANVTGRAGAAIGDTLSLVLQIKRNIPLRQEFQHMDWEVLSRPLEDYITWRVKDGTSRST